MDYLVTIDASLSLEDTAKRCEVEQGGGYQLDNIKFGTIIDNGKVFPVNKAEFDEKLTGRLKNLSFVLLGDNDKPDDVRKTAEKDAWIFICDSQIYVESHVKHIMVFGKKNF